MTRQDKTRGNDKRKHKTQKQEQIREKNRGEG